VTVGGSFTEPEQIISVFRSRVKPLRVGLLRKIAALFVLSILILMPLFYVGVMGGVVFGMYWLATSQFGRAAPPAVYWLLEVVGGFVLLCLLKPLVEPRRRVLKNPPLTIEREPVLHEFLTQVCQQIDALVPRVVQLECSPRVAASYCRGRLGLPQREVTLTLGLPLVACLSIEQLAGLLAGHLSLHRRGAGCYVMNLIRGINGWVWQSVYGRSRLDEWLALVAERPHFHMAKLLLPLRGTAWISRAVLFVPMFIANTIAGAIVERAEMDADRLTVRMVGHSAFATLLAQLEMTDFAWQGILAELEFLHKEQQLPDSLPDQLALRMLDTTPEVYAALRDTINKPEETTFDTRLSSAERLAATEGEPAVGVIGCALPARLLFSDFGATARKMTWDYYVQAFGPQHLKTGIKPVVLPSAPVV